MSSMKWRLASWSFTGEGVVVQALKQRRAGMGVGARGRMVCARTLVGPRSRHRQPVGVGLKLTDQINVANFSINSRSLLDRPFSLGLVDTVASLLIVGNVL